MWLFNNPPRKQLKDKYGFEVTDAWLDHVQKSSVRFNSGGSGEFVSEDGLVMSNHHVGADALQKFGDKDHNYIRDGFRAKTRGEEKRCLDLELNVLMSIEDVTARVNAAVKPEMTPAGAFAARRSVMAAIEKESTDKTGLRSDVVTLYQGGQYHLYCFKKYTDVRLVFAPEQQAAFYGGDPDNFEYPRFDLDICFFRAYENGQPAKIQHHLNWSKAGAAENELVFVSGHPGRTSREFTAAELDYMRDNQLPYTLARLNRLEVLLLSYSGRSDENARKSREDLFGIQNSRKAYDGRIAGLLDPELTSDRAAAARKLGDMMPPEMRPAAQKAERTIAAAQAVMAEHALRYRLLETSHGFMSTSFGIARTLLRAGDERAKPNGERLREFRDSARESMELQLFSEEPLYADYEILKLADSLAFLEIKLGAEDALVKSVLAGKSPRERAAELINGAKVRDVAFRKKMYGGGSVAVTAAHDPLIELARLIDGPSREVRKIIEEQDEVKQQAHAQLSKAKFAALGTSVYPDATFTLRLAYGAVKGYETGGQKIPFETTFAGLYERAGEHHNKPPFDLPPRWVERKSRLNLATPFNFVCTADIIGGNSGSPVVNKDAELVGIIFDGNLESLVFDFVYTEKVARAVSVHSSAIVEALRKVYDANELADELTRRKK